jgi:hypothetical protein
VSWYAAHQPLPPSIAPLWCMVPPATMAVMVCLSECIRLWMHNPESNCIDLELVGFLQDPALQGRYLRVATAVATWQLHVMLLALLPSTVGYTCAAASLPALIRGMVKYPHLYNMSEERFERDFSDCKATMHASGRRDLLQASTASEWLLQAFWRRWKRLRRDRHKFFNHLACSHASQLCQLVHNQSTYTYGRTSLPSCNR